MRPVWERAVVGLGSAAAALSVSLTDIKEGLQVMTLAAGLALTLVSLASAIRALRKDRTK